MNLNRHDLLLPEGAHYYIDMCNKVDMGLSILRLDDLDDPLSLRWITSNLVAQRILKIPNITSYFGKRLIDEFPQVSTTERLYRYAKVIHTQISDDLGEVVVDFNEYLASQVYKIKAIPLADQCVGLFFTDITEEKYSQQENERQANRLRVLNEASHIFAMATNDYDKLLNLVVRHVAEVIKDTCLIRLVSEDGEYLNLVALYDADEEAYTFIKKILDVVPVRVDEQIPNEVLVSGQPVLNPTVNLEQIRAVLKPELWPILDRVGAKSLIITPLRVQERSIGLLYIYRRDPALPPLGQDDLNLAQDLANRAALAIENARLVLDLEKRVLARTTEIMQSRKELREALVKEKEMSELKSRFISMVSHEFRTPLAVILSSTNMIRLYGEQLTQESQRQKLVHIEQQVQHLTTLVDNILAATQTDQIGLKVKKTAFNVDELCRELLNNLTYSLTSPRDIVFREFGNCELVVTDKTLLQQILMNLLTNAIKYSPPEQQINLNLICDNEALTLQVQDRGIGIPQEDLDHLFEMFHRSTNSEKIPGTGVGLAIVKQAVDALEGSIMVESQINEGTSFTVVLSTV